MPKKVKKTTPTAWTKAERNTLAKMLKAGNSAVETAAVLGRTVAAVWNQKWMMKEAGIVSGAFRNNKIPMKAKKTSAKSKSSAKASITVSKVRRGK